MQPSTSPAHRVSHLHPRSRNPWTLTVACTVLVLLGLPGCNLRNPEGSTHVSATSGNARLFPPKTQLVSFDHDTREITWSVYDDGTGNLNVKAKLKLHAGPRDKEPWLATTGLRLVLCDASGTILQNLNQPLCVLYGPPMASDFTPSCCGIPVDETWYVRRSDGIIHLATDTSDSPFASYEIPAGHDLFCRLEYRFSDDRLLMMPAEQRRFLDKESDGSILTTTIISPLFRLSDTASVAPTRATP